MRHGKRICAFEEQLDGFHEQPKQQAAAVGLEVLWERIPKFGPIALGTALYHQVDEKNGIFEFIKGRLRVLCFEIPGAVCICSSVFLKQTGKTPKAEVQRAIALKEQYMKEKATGGISYEEG
jgi:Phage derived protein Gp49-like (DUF891).